MSLSPTEQKIYSKLYQKRVIKTLDVVKILDDLHKSQDYITNLRTKGFLQKIKQGVYIIVPPNMIGEHYIADKFLIAGNLKDTYYISHHSALELHGVAESIFSTVYITIKKYSQPISYQDIIYDFLSSKFFFGVEEIRYKSSILWVSDIEKTVLDCIRRIKYAGGLEELVKSISSIPSFNYNRLWEYLNKFDETVLFHKTGFMFESLESNAPPDDFMKKIRKKMSDKVYYLDKSKTSRFNKKWRLMVPKTYGELINIV